MGIHALFLLMIVAATQILTTVSSLPNYPIAKPNCTDHCGSISIPYPFGTNETNNCYREYEFWVTCNEIFNPPKLFLQDSQIEITKISLDGQITLLQDIAYDCYSQDGTRTHHFEPFIELSVYFSVNNTANKFTILGCDTFGTISGYRKFINAQDYNTGCSTTCDGLGDLVEGSCGGLGCCQITSIPKYVWRTEVNLSSYNNHTHVLDFNNCSYGFLVEESAFTFHPENLTNLWDVESLPMVADWSAGNGTCDEASRSNSFTCTRPNTECYDPENGDGFRCRCNSGYQGNQYLDDGCHDIDECGDPALANCANTSSCVNTLGSFICICAQGYTGNGVGPEGCQDIDECALKPNKCSMVCENNIGGFSCRCPKGYHGTGVGENGCIQDQSQSTHQSHVYKLVAGISVAIILLLLASCFLYLEFKRRKSNQMKQEYFLQNGGLLLQEKLIQRERSPSVAKIYSAAELEKATKNFNISMIVGQGGYGTVYKGSLEDNTVVAVKKSKEVDHTQIEQFINEVFVLCHINHRNVVKLLGCCLETSSPLLVYEFISNGTLFDHIHNEKKKISLNWDMRLKIAIETANVLSYLHSAASTPIIHRDVKSANILLDDDFTAKVSDFGASKLVPLDQTQLSTMVQGTFGYLDPEYMQTNQLTEKSDVYSFGVVLIELLTAKKVLSYERPVEDKNLANFFLRVLRQNRVHEILDENIVLEENKEQLFEVARLARGCLSVKGEDRPSMKEVAKVLEGMKLSGKHSWLESEENAEMEPLIAEGLTGFDGYSATIEFDSLKTATALPMRGGR